MPTGPLFNMRMPDNPGALPRKEDIMEQKTTAAKAITSSIGGLAMSTIATPVLPPDAPWWAAVLVWAVPQIIAGLVYLIPNKPA